MSARAEIHTEKSADTLVVPIQAVVERPPLPAAGSAAEEADGSSEEEVKVVFVIEDDEARQRPVETGLSDTTGVEISSGLDAGARVITGPYRALKNLKHGDAVKVSKPAGERRAAADGDAERAEEE
jgi:HlyD family secretion protein